MKKDLTDITVVLDRSGSMSNVRVDTIGGFNVFLEEQRKAPGSAKLTLVQFDHEFTRVVDAIDVENVAPLTDLTYIPRGNTALLDAIGRSIVETGQRLAALPEMERPGIVVFAIITDGHENASKEYSRGAVFDMITLQREKYSWQFLFLGANQDAIAAGQSFGIQAGNAATYQSSGVGTNNAFVGISRGVSKYRSFVPMEKSVMDDEDVQAVIRSGEKVVSK